MSDFPWEKVKDYDEIIYEKYDGIAKITINRPERRNAFTPKTVVELFDAFSLARDDQEVGVIILTGANHDGRARRPGVLLRRRPEGTWQRRLCGRGQHPAPERA